jgi:hypothetical protein
MGTGRTGKRADNAKDPEALRRIQNLGIYSLHRSPRVMADVSVSRLRRRIRNLNTITDVSNRKQSRAI